MTSLPAEGEAENGITSLNENGWLPRRSGVIVVIGGPDGSGKSTLAQRLNHELGAEFRGTLHLHWRPGLLPRLGGLLGRPGGDPATPHAQRPHGQAVSLLVLGYYWLDFFVGGWTKMRSRRGRGHLVIVERGWLDFSVDPRRYRLRVSPRLVRVLGSALPAPDLAIVLEAPPETLLGRKQELPSGELSRQSELWRRQAFPRVTRAVYLDARRRPDDLVRESRSTILELATPKTSGPSDRYDLVAFPTSRSPRWLLPRRPSLAAQHSLLVYYPLTLRARVAWKAVQRFAAAGGFRYFRLYRTPPRSVAEAIEPFLSPGGAVAVAKANHPGRFMALVVGGDGDPRAFVKVARDSFGAEALRNECDALRRFGPLLQSPLSAPEVLHHVNGVLVERPIERAFDSRPGMMPEAVANCLGRFFRATASDRDATLGAAHGDCAPWNLLRTGSGWVLLDWENASDGMPPFYDVFHYVVQSNGELRRPSKKAIIQGFDLRGSVGAIIEAYAEGAGLDPRSAREHFGPYLASSSADLEAEMAMRAVRVRRKLSAMWRSTGHAAAS